ncbi:MAG: carbon-nitrogen family hydrolase [Kiritimatiellaeota bacterium]|nr:carbon-nitrogen family hydrolase [Kiritimatiellota bacterium]
MRLLTAQLNLVWEDKAANLALVEKAVETASSERCDLLVLPEMTLTGFSMNTAVTAEAPGGDSERAFAELAELRSLAIVAGLVERRETGCANVAVVFDSTGEVVAKYAKTRLFPLSGEPDAHIPGDGMKSFKLRGVSAAVAVCYDLRFPELFREVASDVSMIFVIANWPASRSDHWTALLKARAIENQCFVIGVNRTGADSDGTLHSGGSAVFAPDGAETLPVSTNGDFLLFDIDPAVVDEHRRRYPFLSL